MLTLTPPTLLPNLSPFALHTSVIPVVAVASGSEVRRDSLFCPDELDSLFSYFDNSNKLRSCKY